MCQDRCQDRSWEKVTFLRRLFMMNQGFCWCFFLKKRMKKQKCQTKPILHAELDEFSTSGEKRKSPSRFCINSSSDHGEGGSFKVFHLQTLFALTVRKFKRQLAKNKSRPWFLKKEKDPPILFLSVCAWPVFSLCSGLREARANSNEKMKDCIRSLQGAEVPSLLGKLCAPVEKSKSPVAPYQLAGTELL